VQVGQQGIRSASKGLGVGRGGRKEGADMGGSSSQVRVGKVGW